MTPEFLFTSESVTEGHPDKLCDQISDTIVDRYLQQDPFSSVEAETAVSKGILFIAVHFASQGTVDIALAHGNGGTLSSQATVILGSAATL